MPDPVSGLLAANNPLVTLLVDIERRLTELERRSVGAGQVVTIGDFRLTASGDQLIATRRTDGATRVVADFTESA